MKDSNLYLNEADKIIEQINKYLTNRYSDNITFSINDLILETELLLFGYSDKYPALLDLKQMKERYVNREFDFIAPITQKLITVLESFKKFITKHN